MALFVARPSRGSWVFFVLVALGVLAARTYGNYERSVVRRDAPLSELTQDLAVCTFGSDSMWLLAGDRASGWQDAIGAWMRKVVSAPQDPRWPARCVPIAERLVDRLSRVPGSADAQTSARAVLRSLREGANDPFERVAQADADLLPRQLADLFDKVRSLSQGSREGWRASPSRPDRFGTLTVPRALPLRSLPASLVRPTLLTGSSFAAFSTTDGALHVYDASRGTLRDITAGLGSPVGAARGGSLRVERDDGAAWLLPGNAPRTLRAPRDFAIDGAASRFAWDLASTPAAAALLTIDHGSVRARVSPVGAPWTAPVAVGPDESASTAVISATSTGWTVTVLRPTVSVGILEQYTLRLVQPPQAAQAAPLAQPQQPARHGGRHGHAPPVEPAVPPAVAAPVAPPPATLAIEGPAVLAREVNLFGARVLTCASGPSRFFALVNDQGISVIRVLGDTAQTSRAATFWPRDRDVTLSCDAERALVMTSPVLPRSGGFVFSFARGASDVGVAVEPPSVGPQAVVRAVVLVRDGVLAIASNAGALRAFREVSRPGLRGPRPWEPAGIIALATPEPMLTRSFTRIEALSTGDHVSLLVSGALQRHLPRPPEGQEPPPEPPPVAYFSIAGSLDGGASFWSL